jgi:DNA repair exonuclease SbcCD ATPase subunit
MSGAIDLAKGTEKETQLKICEIIGSSKEVFTASSYAGQEQMPDLPKMTDKQLKMLIEEASGTERLERAYVVAQSKVNMAKLALGDAASGIARSERAIVDSDLRLRTNAVRFKEYDEKRKERAEGIQAQIDAQTLEIKKTADAIAAMQPEKIEAGIKLLNGRLDAIKPMNAELEVLRKAATDAGAVVSSLRIKIDAAETRKKHLVAGYENAEEEMKKPCSTCGKPHTADEIDDWKAHRKTLIDGVNAELYDLATQRSEKQVLVIDAQKAFEDYKATIPDMTETLDKLKKFNDVKANIARAEREVKYMQSVVNDNLKPSLEDAIHGDNPHKAALVDEKRTLDGLKVELAERKAAVADKERELAIAEQVAKVFSPAGVRAHILDTVTPYLNDKTAEYLSALSDGSITAVWSTLAETTKGELREKFNIEVKNATGAQSFKGLSGGEKRKVRLATMLALQDLVSTRATKPLSLFIGDEIDDALDPAGLERLMGIFERKARDKGTVLVISHNDLADWCDEVATVTKEGGFSTVSGALCI